MRYSPRTRRRGQFSNRAGAVTKKAVTPHFIALVQEGCLKSFWTHQALKAFLHNCGIPERLLASRHPDETKRIFLGRLFEELPRIDGGRAALSRIASFLAEQESFPDLANWEGSEKKISEARTAVMNLTRYLARQETEARSAAEREAARAAFHEHRERALQSQKTLLTLAERLNELARRLGEPQAGYEFQDWFYDLLDFFEVPCKRPYVQGGRQIDGSFTIAGTTYLAELKFTNGQAGAPDIDTFFRKVSSKADNTMGVMISISGYSSVARQEASAERTPILLLDHEHLYYVLGGVIGFSQLVDRVRRHASQTGDAYLRVADFGG